MEIESSLNLRVISFGLYISTNPVLYLKIKHFKAAKQQVLGTQTRLLLRLEWWIMSMTRTVKKKKKKILKTKMANLVKVRNFKKVSI